MIQIPDEIRAAAKSNPNVFLTQVDYTPPGMCENCAGMGALYAIVAESGPFRDPPGLASKDKIMTSFEDPMYGWVWYIGRRISGVCPVCRGLGKLPKPLQPLKQFPAPQAVRQLAEQFSK